MTAAAVVVTLVHRIGGRSMGKLDAIPVVVQQPVLDLVGKELLPIPEDPETGTAHKDCVDRFEISRLQLFPENSTEIAVDLMKG